MPDLNLQMAMEEIKVILKRYDCAAAVTLVSPKSTEFLYEFSPTWSCAWLERLPGKDGFAVRVRSKLADYPSKEAQKESIQNTTGMLMGIANQAERTREQMLRIVAMIAKTMDIFHVERREGERKNNS